MADECTVDGIRPDLFADSGAYSAHTMGVEIDVTEYVAWLNRWNGLFTTVANLDVIGDHAASMRNLRALEECGINALPVFHTTTSDFEVFEDLCERYDYVGVGGMVGYQPKTIFPWLVRVHKIARKHDTRLHGFGQTSQRPLDDLPWYTVDSTSWASGYRYGNVRLFHPHQGKRVAMSLGDRKQWLKSASVVREYGFDPQDFYDRSRNTRGKIAGLAMASMRAEELYLRGRHGVQSGPVGDGLRMYAAEGSGSNIALAVEMGVRRYVPGYAATDTSAPDYVAPG